MGKRSDARHCERTQDADGILRLDKWIWFARFQRSRETCAELVRKGHVRVNGRKVVQPGTFVRVGDVLTLALPEKTVVIEIAGLAERRQGSGLAINLYRLIEPVARQSLKND